MSKEYYRKEVHRRKRLTKTWRKPKGMHSKVRRKERQVIDMPSSRRRSPAKTRGLHPSGFEEILVSTLSQLEKIDPKTQVARFSKMGRKKKTMLFNHAKKQKIKVLNFKPEVKEKKEEVKIEKQKEEIKKKETPKPVKKEVKKTEKPEKKEVPKKMIKKEVKK